mmetsp:Transcript_2787/g.5814  ORF Transcript_2787/g.5814 Transcript_2787/m.5814 type:complete len:116 (-) Transcript_2787:693-1040(-)
MSNTSLIVAESKEAVPLHLNTCIATLARQAISARGAFTVALSGGSYVQYRRIGGFCGGRCKDTDTSFPLFHHRIGCLPSCQPSATPLMEKMRTGISGIFFWQMNDVYQRVMRTAI